MHPSLVYPKIVIVQIGHIPDKIHKIYTEPIYEF